jgi:hypothetical protein
MRITIETQSQLVIHLGSARVWCEHRLSEMEMLCLESAVELAQVEVKAARAWSITSDFSRRVGQFGST